MVNNFMKAISDAGILQLVLFFMLLALTLPQVLYNIVFYIRLLSCKQFFKDGGRSPVSVLMTVRNEEGNLSANMPRLLAFGKPDYEVIVVDDFSQDNSLSVLGKLREANPKLKISSLTQETRYSIKLSQNIALKSAKYDWVLFVPPSTVQLQDNWLENVSASILGAFDVVVNYSNVTGGGGFFNMLYRIETFLLYSKNVKYAMAGLPFVYFEDNVAFRKGKFFEMGGYGRKIKEPFANMELLFNQFLSKKKTRFVLNDKTAIRFSEKIYRHDYLDLIRKSFCIEQHLSPFKRILLFACSVGKLLMLPLIVATFILFVDVWPVLLIVVSLLLILHLLVVKTMQNCLNERKIFIYSLLYQLIVPYLKVFSRWHFNRQRHRKNGRAKFKII